MRPNNLATLLAAALLGVAGAASADTGVSDSRITLPEGPGSLEGLGENVSINASMGAMTQSVPFEVPSGFAGLTPELGLEYNSGNGSGIVGIGWDMRVPSIERTTFRGLPEYDTDDGFAAEGGSELVYVSGTTDRVYRARFEGGFVRYTWRSAGSGDEGYWTAEYPDGRVAYFGATADGTLVAESRVGGADGTFRYNLVEMVDVHGHSTVYEWESIGSTSLLSIVYWVFDGDDARYRAEFNYRPRPDAISDGKGGFEELLEHRLSNVEVYVGDANIRTYELTYEAAADSGGMSRLQSVETYGLDGSLYPAVFTYGYSQALGSGCTAGASCEEPYVASLGNIGASPLAGRSTLADLNGDALPDFIDTSDDGAHRIYMNSLTAAGVHTLEGPSLSAHGTGASFRLGTGSVQVMDVDGDGFADMLDSRNGAVLRATGDDDWAAPSTVWATGDGGMPNLGDDFDSDDGELTTIRFVDIDNDRRIDVLRSNGDAGSNVVDIFRNTGSGYETLGDVMAIGAGFDSDRLQLADMNGDGLQDVVQVSSDQIRYRLSLGFGVWTEWTTVALDLTGIALEDIELEDMNGDAVADVVVVQADTVRYWLNRNAGSFDAEQSIAADASLAFPTRDANTAVLYADMNANGTTDIVWVTLSGDVTYLELFPLRPNLLTRVENGLGAVTEVSYATNVEMAAMAAEDGRDWAYSLPYPMTVVESVDVYDELTDLHEVTTYRYFDGYFDAGEKQFRGYEVVEALAEGDASQESGLTVTVIDIGDVDRYFASKPIRTEIFAVSGDSVEPLQRVEQEWADCPVTLTDGSDPGAKALPIRHICQVATETTYQERAPEEDWVTTRSTVSYDGYGNVVSELDMGVVVPEGGSACGPCERPSDAYGEACGASCEGDEMFTYTQYASPEDNIEGRWVLNLPTVVETSAEQDLSRSTRTEYYYDGDDFTGLPLGQASRGNMTRERRRTDETADTWITPRRVRYDGHGNAVEELDALGAPGSTEHRTLYTYSDDGLRPTSLEVFLEDDEGAYSLRQEVTYDPTWDNVNYGTSYVVYADGSPTTPDNASSWTYDAFGRLATTIRPGDSAENPSETYEYDLASPVSRIVTRRSSTLNGPLDEVAVRCIDGRGRTVQERVRIEDGRWAVAGFTIYNTRSQPVREYLPFDGTSDACETNEPTGELFAQYRYDAVGRLLEATHPDADVFGGTASVERREYGPLTETRYDRTDFGASATPTQMRMDGMGRTVQVLRSFEPGTLTPYHTVTFDVFGNVDGFVDADGNRHVETYDEAGRVTAIDDPNRGLSTYELDAEGNVMAETGEDGVIVRYEYDGLNRQVASWDDADPNGTRISRAYDRSALCGGVDCTNGANQLVAVEFPLGTDAADNARVGGELYGYDTRGRQVRRALTLEDYTFVTEYAYDNADRRSGVTHPDGTEITYAYDGVGRITSIPGYVDSASYDGRGDLIEVAYANGVTTTNVRDDARRVAQLDVQGPAGTLMQHDYTYTRDGDMLSIRENGVRSVFADADYTYDGARRLTAATLSPTDGATEDLAWAFDAIDNLTSATSSLGDASAAHVGDYTYGDRPNAVTQAGPMAYAYDDVGNMTSRGDATLVWDHLDRLIASEEGGVTTSEHFYGPGEMRIMRDAQGSVIHYVTNDFELEDGVATTWVRLDAMRIARSESTSLMTQLLPDIAVDGGAADNTITAGDAWAADATERGAVTSSAPAAFDPERYMNAALRRVLADAAEEPTVFVHEDYLGSIVLATDEAGVLLDEQAFYPWGEMLAGNSGWIGRYGYTGQEWDAALGMWRFAARLYDPFAGRWISPDPEFAHVDAAALTSLGEATTAYAYVANGPSWNIDPDGRKSLRKRFVATRVGRGFKRVAQSKAARGVREGLRLAHSLTNQNAIMGADAMFRFGSFAKRKNRVASNLDAYRVTARLNSAALTHPRQGLKGLIGRATHRTFDGVGQRMHQTGQGTVKRAIITGVGQVPVVGWYVGIARVADARIRKALR